jgi:hypothetical protein
LLNLDFYQIFSCFFDCLWSFGNVFLNLAKVRHGGEKLTPPGVITPQLTHVLPHPAAAQHAPPVHSPRDRTRRRALMV